MSLLGVLMFHGASAYTVAGVSLRVGGLQAGGSQNITIFYPVEAPEAGDYFPVISFLHGVSVSGDPNAGVNYLPYAFGPLFRNISAKGFVIVAPESCPSGYCFNLWLDGLHAIRVSQNSSVHPAFKYADTRRVGVIGHSMGGEEAIYAATHDGGLNVSVVVAMNPAVELRSAADLLKVPVMYTTGTLDDICLPPTVENAYQNTPSRPKIFANLEGSAHPEPEQGQGPMRLHPFIASWVACILKDSHNDCLRVYGGGSDTPLCSAYKFHKCDIQQQ